MGIRDLARKNIFDVKPYRPGKPIEEVQRELGLGSVIKLASNENPLGPSPKALRAAKKALASVNRYPDASQFYLKSKLAEKLGVASESLIIGNGSDEIITLAVRAFLSEGDEVIIAEPTFLIYAIASKIAGAKIVSVPLEGLKYNLAAIKAKITPRTKMIFIANPDNPTGTYVTNGELKEFFKDLPRDLIVFYDEAYYEFAKNLQDFPNIFDYFGEGNIIATRTFSKIYGLSGLRVGYGIADSNIIDLLNRTREPFNVNSVALAAACAALDDEEFLKRTVKTTEGGRRYLYRELKKINMEYIPSATNFVLIDIKRDAKEIFNKLLKKGVIVRDMKAWKLDTFIRVTIGTMAENRRFIKALKEALR